MLIVFEDELWHHFAPLSYTRPVYELRCGAYTTRERIRAVLESHPALTTQQRSVVQPNLSRPVFSLSEDHARAIEQPLPLGICRPYLMDCYGAIGGIGAVLRESMPITLINGRALTLDWLPRLLAAPINTVYVCEDALLAASITPALASVVLYYLRDQQAGEALSELRRFARVVEVQATMVRYPWDLITEVGEQLVRDHSLLTHTLPRYHGKDPNVVVYGCDQVFVATSAQLDGPLVLDGRDGPLYIDEGAHIEPFSFVQGPAYIGPRTLIASALIRGESSFGPVCRVGGEVEASVMQGYSNKHHDGFLGHSWLGEWVNIGAMTTNSDLKNTYSSVRVVIDQLGQVDSGVMKLGCFLADHVKLGIGLHLPGGAVVGTGSNIFSVHMVPKTVPPFTWGSDVFYEYEIARMITVAERVMKRRKITLTPDYRALLETVFQMTRAHRTGATQVAGAGSRRQRAAAAAASTQLANAEQAVVQ